MAAIPSKISDFAWGLLPGPVRRRLQSEAGRRFLRFVPVSLAALATSQVSLAVLVGVIGVSAGFSAFIASVLGAAVSYLLSRWAWERRGRPDLLRETLPFWVISVGAWIFLSFASHEASIWSRSMGHSHWERTAVISGVYFLANCLTFAARFLIFHYVLFARPGGRGGAAPAQAAAPDTLPDAVPGGPAQDVPVPLELAVERRAEPPTRRL